jgi:cytochrome P450 family 142 subfamily A polypeptide 1
MRVRRDPTGPLRSSITEDTRMNVNVTDPRLYGGDPYPVYAWLRENAPLYWDAASEAWVVSRHADVVQVSKSSDVFSAEPSILPDRDTQVSIACMDNPRHQRLRTLVNKGFTPRMVANLESSARAIVTECLDAIADKGACDLVKDVAVPLPMVIIAQMMGIPPDHYDRFHQWSDALIGSTTATPDNPEALVRAAGAYVEYGAYLKQIFEDVRVNPRDDLVSILVGAQAGGALAEDEEAMENDELLMFMTLLLVAGNETTRNAISGGMEALIRNPDQRRLLIDRPELMSCAVDEVLRFVTPIVCFRRTAMRATEIRGQRIEAGQKVVMLYQSANRDPEVFERPDAFDVTRDPNPHLAFGIGNHFCLGANLARMEIRVALEEILRRFPDMDFEAGAEPVRIASTLFRGIESMPLVFSTPGA